MLEVLVEALRDEDWQEEQGLELEGLNHQI